MRVDSQAELNEWILAQIAEIRRERFRRPMSQHQARQETRWTNLRSLLHESRSALLGADPSDPLEGADPALNTWLLRELAKPYDWPRAATVRLVINLYRGDVRKSSCDDMIRDLNRAPPYHRRQDPPVNVALVALERLAPDREALPFTKNTKNFIRQALTSARKRAAWEASRARE